jgi:simple sugar transport system permease protein
MLCCAGLMLTFATGLWNIGVEGQITLGAIAATATLRAGFASLPPALLVFLAALAAMAGGAAWGALVGVLRRYGGVHEIFGGLGFNFIAGSLTVYLVLGPFKRAGIASTSGTEPFDPSLWLPPLSPAFPISIHELAAAFLVLLLAVYALKSSRLGLALRATGQNPGAAFRLGVPVARLVPLAMALCGAAAGLCGFFLVLGAGARHNLYPMISSGYGYLAILISMLAAGRPLMIAASALFFAALSMGSLQLALVLQLDSSFGGVMQGALVLAVILLRKDVLHSFRTTKEVE